MPPAVAFDRFRQPSAAGDDGATDAAPDVFAVQLDSAALDATLFERRKDLDDMHERKGLAVFSVGGKLALPPLRFLR